MVNMLVYKTSKENTQAQHLWLSIVHDVGVGFEWDSFRFCVLCKCKQVRTGNNAAQCYTLNG